MGRGGLLVELIGVIQVLLNLSRLLAGLIKSRVLLSAELIANAQVCEGAGFEILSATFVVFGHLVVFDCLE